MYINLCVYIFGFNHQPVYAPNSKYIDTMIDSGVTFMQQAPYVRRQYIESLFLHMIYYHTTAQKLRMTLFGSQVRKRLLKLENLSRRSIFSEKLSHSFLDLIALLLQYCCMKQSHLCPFLPTFSTISSYSSAYCCYCQSILFAGNPLYGHLSSFCGLQ